MNALILMVSSAFGIALASSPFACPAGIMGIENYGNCFHTRCCQDERFRCFKRIGQKGIAECKPMSETCGAATDWLCPGTWEEKEIRQATWEEHYNAKQQQTGQRVMPRPPPTAPYQQTGQPKAPPRPFACPADVEGTGDYGNCIRTKCCLNDRFLCFKRVGEKKIAMCKPMSETCGAATDWLCPGTWEDKETRRARREVYHNAEQQQAELAAPVPLPLPTTFDQQQQQSEQPATSPMPPPNTPGLQQSMWAAIVVALGCIIALGCIVVDQCKQRGQRQIRALLIFICNPKKTVLKELPDAEIEGSLIGEFWNESINTFGARGASLKTLRTELSKRPTRRFHFAGHTLDVLDHTLGFTTADGTIDFESVDKVVDALREHSKHLEFVFINGCKSLDFGNKLIDAGIPRVLCWKTEAEDKAASEFAVRFYLKLQENNNDYGAAYEAAKQHVLEMKRTGRVGPVEGLVQKYEFRDPNAVSHSKCDPKPMAAGIPVLLPDESEMDSRTTTSEQQQEPDSPALSDLVVARGMRKRQTASPSRVQRK